MTESLEELAAINAKIAHLDEMINKWSKENADTQKLLTIPGFGSVVSCSLVSHIGDASKIENGRQMAAYLTHFGHGKTTLSSILVVFNLLAFSMHSLCDSVEEMWRKAR